MRQSIVLHSIYCDIKKESEGFRKTCVLVKFSSQHYSIESLYSIITVVLHSKKISSLQIVHLRCSQNHFQILAISFKKQWWKQNRARWGFKGYFFEVEDYKNTVNVWLEKMKFLCCRSFLYPEAFWVSCLY